MSIRVVCRNGHSLNVKDSMAGKIGLCPMCKARVQVPEIARDALSEDAILGILGPPRSFPLEDGLAFEKTDPFATSAAGRIEPEGTGPPLKSCEKCGQLILTGTHICPHCHTYIGKLEDF